MLCDFVIVKAWIVQDLRGNAVVNTFYLLVVLVFVVVELNYTMLTAAIIYINSEYSYKAHIYLIINVSPIKQYSICGLGSRVPIHP